jgi:hypothetical protein
MAHCCSTDQQAPVQSGTTEVPIEQQPPTQNHHQEPSRRRWRRRLLTGLAGLAGVGFAWAVLEIRHQQGRRKKRQLPRLGQAGWGECRQLGECTQLCVCVCVCVCVCERAIVFVCTLFACTNFKSQGKYQGLAFPWSVNFEQRRHYTTLILVAIIHATCSALIIAHLVSTTVQPQARSYTSARIQRWGGRSADTTAWCGALQRAAVVHRRNRGEVYLYIWRLDAVE